ncbi:MAG: HAMP domain-containing sensor histidine kinase [Phenylobacterium sp.]|nr:HAMP domain-containing sensor histidine kinase [Phenylobacterium sp.]
MSARMGQAARGMTAGTAVVAFTWLFTAVLLAYACLAFAPVTPPERLWAWAALGGLQLTWWAVLSLRLVPGTPSRASNRRFWRRAGRVVALGNNAVVVCGILVVMPYGSFDLRVIAMLFCISYVAVTIMSTPAFGWIHYLTTGTTTLALIFVVMRDEPAQATYLLPFFVIFSASLLWLGRTLHRSKLALAAARHTAEAERDARLQFLASASHDFGQPLQAARLYYDQMLMSTAAADRRRAALSLERALDSMEQMVGQVTEHLRLDAGAVAAARTPVALNRVIAEVVELNELPARARGVQLRTLPTRLVVPGDPVLIERALGNLIGNAIRHAGARRVLIGPKRTGDRIRLWVIDDGRGVAEADRPRLFDAYVQGSDHGEEVRGGYGLGLSAVRLIASALGASAGYEPRWLHGSAFFLEFPVREFQPAPHEGVTGGAGA